MREEEGEFPRQLCFCFCPPPPRWWAIRREECRSMEKEQFFSRTAAPQIRGEEEHLTDVRAPGKVVPAAESKFPPVFWPFAFESLATFAVPREHDLLGKHIWYIVVCVKVSDACLYVLLYIREAPSISAESTTNVHSPPCVRTQGNGAAAGGEKDLLRYNNPPPGPAKRPPGRQRTV